MRQGTNKKKLALLAAAWLAAASIAALVAYWFMGAVPMGEDDPGYASRLLTVLGDPFGNHFNEYSAFGIAGAVILVTLAFGIAYFAHFAPAPEEPGGRPEDGWEENPANGVQENGMAQEETEEETPASDDGPIGISEEAFLRLMNKGFGPKQIDALIELSEYAPEIGIDKIAGMVSPSMPAEEMRKYIEVFFG